MNSVILSKTYPQPQFCEKEILRYAGCKRMNSEISALLKSCLDEAESKLTYSVCYRELPVVINDDICDFDAFSVRSKNLAQNLKDCKSVIIFAATIGVEIDRLIAKYGRISPSKALMFQAIGAERIEALCDTFCTDIAIERNATLKPRFSPGYGDLPLDVQKDLFSLLDCSRRIGLSLNNSLLMSPSKSVTAFAGICADNTEQTTNKCSVCNKTDCTFRGTL